MNKKLKIVIGAVIIAIILLFTAVGYGLYLMSIEDKYGDLQEVYHNASDDDIIIVDNQDVGLIKKLDGEVYVEQSGCLRHLLYYYDKKLEVYHVDDKQTFTSLNYHEALQLKTDPQTKLIYKN